MGHWVPPLISKPGQCFMAFFQRDQGNRFWGCKMTIFHPTMPLFMVFGVMDSDMFWAL